MHPVYVFTHSQLVFKRLGWDLNRKFQMALFFMESSTFGALILLLWINVDTFHFVLYRTFQGYSTVLNKHH